LIPELVHQTLIPLGVFLSCLFGPACPQPPTSWTPEVVADLNRDGLVDLRDVALLQNSWDAGRGICVREELGPMPE
jgi:hypothetical protein